MGAANAVTVDTPDPGNLGIDAALESIFYLGTTNFLGGSFFIKNHKNPSGGTPTCKKSGVFGQKPAFLEPSII